MRARGIVDSPAGIIAGVVVLLLLAGIPLLDSVFVTSHVTRILIYAIFAMSLDLLVGYCGLVSLGPCRILRRRRLYHRTSRGEAGHQNC